FVANNHVETRDMVQQMGLEYFVGNPQQALADELLLRFKPNLTDPLPLYIVLLLTLSLTLPLMLRKLEVAVGLSIALYLMVPLFGWNLRAYEGGGVWYFNPVAWQLLFILGGACALRSETRHADLQRKMVRPAHRAGLDPVPRRPVPHQQNRPGTRAPAALPRSGLRGCPVVANLKHLAR
ncbi:hypothetical protein APX70_01401, partial [Pseudomonas syringae pv. maculicola]